MASSRSLKGCPSGVTDPRNLVTTTSRNGLGDATQLVSPDTGTASATYDAAGNLKTRTDSRGVLATYSYDALNRLTSLNYSQGGLSLPFSWTYDDSNTNYPNAIGRLSYITFPAGNAQRGYDPQGRVTVLTQRLAALSNVNAAMSLGVGYTYDAGGHLTALRYPSGRVLSISYTNGLATAMGLKASTSTTAQPLLTAIQFNPFAGPQGWSWAMTAGPQAYAKFFDTSGRPVRYPLGSLVRDLTYDAAGRITAYTHYDGTSAAAQPAYDQNFGYDELGRLTSMAGVN